MRKSILKLLWAVAALMLSSTVSAVGMGGINVTSGLGQQLKADIELVAVNKAEKASLVARLASPDIYKGAGLEYPYGNKFKFQVESRADGEPYLKVTSAQPINDPFVVMLVELTWSSGKLLREYTFLLDPPGYVAELPVQAEVQAVAPAVQSVPTGAEAIPVEPVAPTEVVGTVEPVTSPEAVGSAEQGVSAAASAPEAASVEQGTAQSASAPEAASAQIAPETAVAPEPVASGDAAESKEVWLTVQRGDTLGALAAQHKPADVSLERMLVAFYRANADEFNAKNMNRIRAGKFLRLPKPSEIDAVEQAEAVKEIRAQAADWNAYRQKLAGAAEIRKQAQDAEQVATGKLSSSVADKAPVAKESAKEVLKLSKGEAPGDQAAAGAGGKSMTAQDKNNAAQEDAIAKGKAEKEAQVRSALLEKNLQDMQRLVQLKSEAAALAQQPPVAPVSEVAAVSAVSPAPVVKPPPAPVKPEPTLIDQAFALLDQLVAQPLYLAGGVAVLLVLGALAWLVNRRKKKPTFEIIGQFSEDATTRSGRVVAPVAPSPETGDFTGMVAAKVEANDQSNDVDPISEADLFLNFGRDVQAEEILKDALKDTPNNHKIHLKLLEIYANRKDVNSFAAIVRQLQDSGDEAAIQRALAMGRELEPNNPVYGGAATTPGEASLTMPASTPGDMSKAGQGSTSVPAAPVVDFNFDALATKTMPSPEQNFLDDAVKTVVMTPADTAVKPTGAMDFDITTATPPMATAVQAEKPPAYDTGNLIFDVTGSHPSIPAVGEATEVEFPKLDGMTFDVTGGHATSPATQADTDMMEFTLDFPVENKAEKSAPAVLAPEMDLSGISLNFDDAAAPSTSTSTAETKGEHWQEVATKLDLAKAYQEMGDSSGAREILEEVLREGDTEQREAAQSLIAQLG